MTTDEYSFTDDEYHEYLEESAQDLLMARWRLESELEQQEKAARAGFRRRDERSTATELCRQ